MNKQNIWLLSTDQPSAVFVSIRLEDISSDIAFDYNKDKHTILVYFSNRILITIIVRVRLGNINFDIS